MTIPIRNLYYLLAYAWDLLEQAEIVDVDATAIDTPLELCARVLSAGLDRLVRRGIDRGYVSQIETLSGLRGRILLAASVKSGALRKGHLVCESDELSFDVQHNRVIKATLRNLLSADDLPPLLRRSLRVHADRLDDVCDIRLTDDGFARIQLHTNRRLYRLLINICRLLHAHLLPSPGGKGYRFVDFTDEGLEDLFEMFLRNFYLREQRIYPEVKRERFRWQAAVGEEDAIRLLPMMETDVSMLRDDARLVIEAKFYKNALADNARFQKETLRSAHLYQLFAYLRNLERSDGRRTAGY